MALTYFFVYVVRQGVTSWFIFYLIKERAIENAAEAALRVSGLELGGLFGSLLAGKLSDWMINKEPTKGSVGKRVQVVMWYTVGVALSLMAFVAVPTSASALQWFTVFMIGFFLYGPQMLIGEGCTGLICVHLDWIGRGTGSCARPLNHPPIDCLTNARRRRPLRCRAGGPQVGGCLGGLPGLDRLPGCRQRWRAALYHRP